MSRIAIYFTIWKTTGFKRLGAAFGLIFGGVWLLLEPAGVFFPDSFDLGWIGYGGLATAAFAGALVYRWPHRTVSGHLSSPDTTIEVTVGDLFDQQCHLIIGSNDVFDTEPGDIIEPRSVQGQFLTRIYQGDLARLDVDIAAALAPYDDKKQADPNKARGKQLRYPIGTTIVLGDSKRRFFLTAYGKMGSNLVCESDTDCIWLALSNAWKAVGERGHLQPVAIPIVGSELARIGLPRMIFIRMIIISFIVASKQRPVSKRLTIVVHPSDLDKVNLHDINDFLQAACF